MLQMVQIFILKLETHCLLIFQREIFGLCKTLLLFKLDFKTLICHSLVLGVKS